MMSSKSWDPFVESLSEKNQLIRVDFLDQGQSDILEDSYTQTIQLELLIALIRHLRLEKVSIVGISYGGEVALLFAVKYREYLDKLIIFNSVAYTNEELYQTGLIWNEYAKNREIYKYYMATIPIIYSKHFSLTNKNWMKNREELLLNNVFNNHDFLDRMIRLTNSASKYDVREELKQLEHKVLIIGSDEDLLTPLSEQILLHKLIKNSELLIIPNVGHASMYEVPNLFTTIILGHLENNFDIKIV